MLGTFFEVKKNDGFLTKIAMQIDRDMYSVNKSTCILTALSYQLYIYIYHHHHTGFISTFFKDT